MIDAKIDLSEAYTIDREYVVVANAEDSVVSYETLEYLEWLSIQNALFDRDRSTYSTSDF
jgi:hypothetical protein